MDSPSITPVNRRRRCRSELFIDSGHQREYNCDEIDYHLDVKRLKVGLDQQFGFHSQHLNNFNVGHFSSSFVPFWDTMSITTPLFSKDQNSQSYIYPPVSLSSNPFIIHQLNYFMQSNYDQSFTIPSLTLQPSSNTYFSNQINHHHLLTNILVNQVPTYNFSHSFAPNGVRNLTLPPSFNDFPTSTTTSSSNYQHPIVPTTITLNHQLFHLSSSASILKPSFNNPMNENNFSISSPASDSSYSCHSHSSSPSTGVINDTFSTHSEHPPSPTGNTGPNFSLSQYTHLTSFQSSLSLPGFSHFFVHDQSLFPSSPVKSYNQSHCMSQVLPQPHPMNQIHPQPLSNHHSSIPITAPSSFSANEVIYLLLQLFNPPTSDSQHLKSHDLGCDLQSQESSLASPLTQSPSCFTDPRPISEDDDDTMSNDSSDAIRQSDDVDEKHCDETSHTLDDVQVYERSTDIPNLTEDSVFQRWTAIAGDIRDPWEFRGNSNGSVSTSLDSYRHSYRNFNDIDEQSSIGTRECSTDISDYSDCDVIDDGDIRCPSYCGKCPNNDVFYNDGQLDNQNFVSICPIHNDIDNYIQTLHLSNHQTIDQIQNSSLLHPQISKTISTLATLPRYSQHFTSLESSRTLEVTDHGSIQDPYGLTLIEQSQQCFRNTYETPNLNHCIASQPHLVLSQPKTSTSVPRPSSYLTPMCQSVSQRWNLILEARRIVDQYLFGSFDLLSYEYRTSSTRTSATILEVSNAYEEYCVGDEFVKRLIEKDWSLERLPRSYQRQQWVNFMRSIHEASRSLIEWVFPLYPSGVSSIKNFPNYLTLDAICLLRAYFVAFLKHTSKSSKHVELGQADNQTSMKASLDSPEMYRSAVQSINEQQLTTRDLFLIITASLLLACDLNESCDYSMDNHILKKLRSSVEISYKKKDESTLPIRHDTGISGVDGKRLPSVSPSQSKFNGGIATLHANVEIPVLMENVKSQERTMSTSTATSIINHDRLANSIEGLEHDTVGRSENLKQDLKRIRHLVCTTLEWSLVHYELRQWIEVIVTRMAILQALDGSIHEGWTELYFTAEAEAASQSMALSYLFDLDSTAFSIAVRCIEINIVNERTNATSTSRGSVTSPSLIRDNHELKCSFHRVLNEIRLLMHAC